TLQEDCSRRDFTVNAMAFDIAGRLYDFYDGQTDLKKRILRTVGCARKRYEEDALRMLRACRFVAQLGFTYVQNTDLLPPFGEPGTPYYLPQNYSFPVERCAGLSLERVRRELEKLLLSAFAGRGLMLFLATGLAGTFCRKRNNGIDSQIPILPELHHLEGLRQNPRFHKYNVWEHTLAAIDNSPKNLSIRWALLLHDIGKGLPEIRKLNKEGQPSDHGHETQSALMAETILTRLGYQKNFIKKVTWLVARHMRFAPMLITGEKALRHWVRTEALSGTFSDSREMTAAYEDLVEVFLADMGATHAGRNTHLMQAGKELGKQVTEIARTQMPIAAGDLDINGHDLLEFLTQSEIRQYLPLLLKRVQSGNLPNEKAPLLAAVKKYLQKRGNKI
ncbi:MAG: HD domain-containing protein, partial [Phascolarctobacterium sp.]|nr:HD domain-containing protein [Phascolarctobacterium sp.]